MGKDYRLVPLFGNHETDVLLLESHIRRHEGVRSETASCSVPDGH